MAKIEVKTGQNIYDIALMTHGTVGGVIDLLKSNPDIDINQNINAGTVLEYTETPNAFSEFVNTKSLIVATDENVSNTGGEFDSGFDGSFN